MCYVIRQVYMTDGKRELGSIVDLEGNWFDGQSKSVNGTSNLKPFTKLEDAREAIPHHRADAEYAGDDIPEFEIVNLQTGMRYSAEKSE